MPTFISAGVTTTMTAPTGLIIGIVVEVTTDGFVVIDGAAVVDGFVVIDGATVVDGVVVVLLEVVVVVPA